MTTMAYSQWVREKQCGSKLAWTPKESKAARANARSSADKYGEPREWWTHYQCDHCGLLHIGHRPGVAR